MLAFDYGTKRIGVAAGNSSVGTAQGIGIVPVRNGKPDSAKIDDLVTQWQPDCFVIGMPGTETGDSTALIDEIKNFAKLLNRDYHIPVFETDERLSTEESSIRIASLSRKSGRKTNSDLRDMIAAEIILETFLSSTDSAIRNLATDKTAPDS